MKFSYSETWAEAVRMIRENLAVIAAIAGVFLFLPALLTSYFIPPPEQVEDPSKLLGLMLEHAAANWPWFVLAQLANMVGGISILLLLLGPRGRTVAAIIAAAVMILPFYLVAALLSGAMILVGLLFLLVPGLYLLGRLAMTGPVVVAEGQRNPIAAITRSFELTKGNGWAVLGLILLVAIAGVIVAAVIGMLLGIIFQLVAGDDLAALLIKIVEAACQTAISALLATLVAAIYLRLGSRASPAAAAAD